MKHVIEFNINTKGAEEDLAKFREVLAKAIKEDTEKLGHMGETMQAIAQKTPWYRQVPPIQWVILVLLVANLIAQLAHP